MKFSAQEEYGLRCLLQIARCSEGVSLTIPEISQREGLSATHVAKLLTILRKERLVLATRGQSGGYTLARTPEKIFVGEVLEALGGKLYDTAFCERHSGQGDTCSHSAGCSLRSLWQSIQASVDDVVYRVTLADLLATASGKTNVHFLDSPTRLTVSP